MKAHRARRSTLVLVLVLMACGLAAWRFGAGSRQAREHAGAVRAAPTAVTEAADGSVQGDDVAPHATASPHTDRAAMAKRNVPADCIGGEMRRANRLMAALDDTTVARMIAAVAAKAERTTPETKVGFFARRALRKYVRTLVLPGAAGLGPNGRPDDAIAHGSLVALRDLRLQWRTAPLGPRANVATTPMYCPQLPAASTRATRKRKSSRS